MKTSLSSGNTSLVTSGAVYYAINRLNTNSRIHIVVVTCDIKNSLKIKSDYTCTLTNVTLVLKTDINVVKSTGKM